jgi:hypothetical protein
MEKPNSPEVAHLLWTGGWDSTFRLLQLLLQKKRLVQPHYIIDPFRKSLGIEMDTMRRLKLLLFHHYPSSRPLLLPTNFINKNLIAPDKKITGTWHILKKLNIHVGYQYEWFARYCKESGLHHLELSLEKSVNPDYSKDIVHYITGYPEYPETKKHSYHASIETNMKFLFQHFSLPLHRITKKEMRTIAEEHGWLPVLEKTWFCHTPFFNSIPCGKCTPCKQIYLDEFTWRMPVTSKAIRLLRKFKHQLFRTPVQTQIKRLAKLHH